MFSTEILAEPIQDPGENPFTPPVGNDQPNVEPPSNVGRTFPGSTSGLYGGTLNNSRLTPLSLRSDTAVTNHGFRDGKATNVHSVLQAGTAVLVDKYGVPRVRCHCGNPLTPPTSFSRPRYVGPTWPRFSPTQITIIQPVTIVINEFIIVNPITNVVIYRPAGTRGERDRGDLQDASIAGEYTFSSGSQCTIERLDGVWARSHTVYELSN